MLEAVLITQTEPSVNHTVVSSGNHRRRHRHDDQINTNSNGGREFDNTNAKNTSDAVKSSSNLYDQLQRNQTSQFDNGYYSGVSSNFITTTTHRPAPAPTYSNTVVSPNFNVIPNNGTFNNNNNHTLMYHGSNYRNNGTKTNQTNNIQNAYNSYYDASSNNIEDSSDYEQYQIVPFNTDENSETPHFDAEFFPEPLDPIDPIFNGTNLPDISADPFPFTPWGSSQENVQPPHHVTSHNTTGSFNFNPFSASNNVTNALFDNGKLHTEYDYVVPALNSSTIMGSDLNMTGALDAAASGDLYTWSILMMAPLVVFGVAGNTLVILAISLEKRLQNVTNYFLLSLAVTDLLVSLIVMPFSIINVFTGRWLFGLLLCDFFVTSDVLMCTSSILHLCTISLERYIGIRYPLWTKNKSKRIVLLKIVLVWTIALAITSPITVLGVIKEDNVLVKGECVLSNEHFIIYGSIFAFFIPLAIMVLMYALTVRMLNKQARLCHSRRADDGEGQPMIRRSTSRRNWQARRKYYGREALSATSSYCGSRLVEYETGTPGSSFNQRYRPLGVNRHNTLPLCHHHNHHHHSDTARRDPGGGLSVNGMGGNGSVVGSTHSINSIHRGRSNNNAVGANNNNSNSCNADTSNGTSNNTNNMRRGRYSNQNGTGGSPYLGRSSPPEYPYCNGHQEEVSSELPSESRDRCPSLSSSSSSPSSSTNREPKRLRELVRKHHVAVKAANILLMKRDGHSQGQGQTQTSTPSSSAYASVRRDNSVRTEQKASKVLGVVFMIFVICWAPFFTVNILTALCTSCKFEPTLITAFVWLGYVSSTLNPIIYTIFNNIFRITFIKLLCCRYRLLHRARRNSNMSGVRKGLLACSAFCAPANSAGSAPNTANSTLVDESHC